MAARVNPVRSQRPRIVGRRHRRGILLVVPALLTAAISGDLSATLPALSVSESGTSADVFTGTLAPTLPALVAAMDGAVVPPPTILRFAPATPRILGRRHRRGVLFLSAPREFNQALDAALPPLAFAAAGTTVNPPIYGQMDVRAPRGATIRTRALAAGKRARGRQIVLGFQYAPLAVVPTVDLNLTLPRLGLSAAGSFAAPVSGTLVLTLPPLTHAETSLAAIAGDLALDLGPLTLNTDGVIENTGALALALPPATHAVAGAVVATDGTLSLLLAPLTHAAVGSSPDVFGELNLTLASLALSTYVPAPRFGVLTIDLPPVTLSLTGATLAASTDGTLALTIPALGWVGYAPAGAFGDLALSLPALALRLQQTDFASLRFQGLGDVAYYLMGVGDGLPIAYLLRGVDP